MKNFMSLFLRHSPSLSLANSLAFIIYWRVVQFANKYSVISVVKRLQLFLCSGRFYCCPCGHRRQCRALVGLRRLRPRVRQVCPLRQRRQHPCAMRRKKEEGSRGEFSGVGLKTRSGHLLIFTCLPFEKKPDLLGGW